MTADRPAEAQALDDLRAAVAAMNKALTEVAKHGLIATVGTTERKFLAHAAPTTIVSVRATRTVTEIDERF